MNTALDEEWKHIIIDGINFNYMISNLGNVWSINRSMLMKPALCNDYDNVILSYDRKKYKFSIHRLVAIIFISNPDNLPFVNHKDGNKRNNNVNNLEWISASNNKLHATTVLNSAGPKVGVDQYSLDGLTYINHYESIAEASRQTGTSHTGIISVCRGKYKSSGGFTWKYSDKMRALEDPEPEGIRHPDHNDYIITNNGRIYNFVNRKYLTLHSDNNGYVCVSLS